jgi:sugar phosphate isomerase/epimerase
MIKKSVVLTAFFPEAVQNTDQLVRGIELAAELGYQTVEFYHEGGALRVRGALSKAGLDSIFLAAWAMKRDGMDLAALSSEELTQIQKWIEQARSLGAERMMILSGPEHEDTEDREIALAGTTAAAAEICRLARSGSPPLGVVMEYFNNTGEPYLLLGPTDRAVDLAETVKTECNNFELTCDLSHLIQLKEDPARSALVTCPHSRHLHLANCVVADPEHPLFGDRHPPFGFDGGEVNADVLTDFLRAIKDQGYFEGPPVTIGVEIIARDGQDGAALLQEATDTVNQSLLGAGVV